MIERLVHLFFRWEGLRNAIFEEVHFYDGVEESLKEPTTNLTWCEDDGLWRGWHYNEKYKIYRFNDVGYENLLDLWEDTWKWESEVNMGPM